MNPSFNIQSPGIDTATAQLTVEIGPTGMSFVILDDKNCFPAVVIYSFPQGLSTADIAEEIKSIFRQEDHLKRSFKTMNIIWTFTESILVPNELYEPGSNTGMLQLVYGDAVTGTVKSDFIFRHNIHNVYRIPANVLNALPDSFQYAHQTHQYSLLPDLAEKTGNALAVIFYSNSFTAMLTKESRLQVIQHFEYRNADDVAYHLLNICESFDSTANETVLYASGMIDTASNLYATLYKYFLNIQLAILPSGNTYAEEIKNYPAHFFSHLFTMATCV